MLKLLTESGRDTQDRGFHPTAFSHCAWLKDWRQWWSKGVPHPTGFSHCGWPEDWRRWWDRGVLTTSVAVGVAHMLIKVVPAVEHHVAKPTLIPRLMNLLMRPHID